MIFKTYFSLLHVSGIIHSTMLLLLLILKILLIWRLHFSWESHLSRLISSWELYQLQGFLVFFFSIIILLILISAIWIYWRWKIHYPPYWLFFFMLPTDVWGLTLLCCSASSLPENYRKLMTDQSSPILDFYPSGKLIDCFSSLWFSKIFSPFQCFLGFSLDRFWNWHEWQALCMAGIGFPVITIVSLDPYFTR